MSLSSFLAMTSAAGANEEVGPRAILLATARMNAVDAFPDETPGVRDPTNVQERNRDPGSGEEIFVEDPHGCHYHGKALIRH